MDQNETERKRYPKNGQERKVVILTCTIQVSFSEAASVGENSKSSKNNCNSSLCRVLREAAAANMRWTTGYSPLTTSVLSCLPISKATQALRKESNSHAGAEHSPKWTNSWIMTFGQVNASAKIRALVLRPTRIVRSKGARVPKQRISPRKNKN